MPLTQVTIGPDFLQAAVSKAQVKDAPNAALDNDGLSPTSVALYHYYELNYTPSDTPSGRRLDRDAQPGRARAGRRQHRVDDAHRPRAVGEARQPVGLRCPAIAS